MVKRLAPVDASSNMFPLPSWRIFAAIPFVVVPVFDEEAVTAKVPCIRALFPTLIPPRTLIPSLKMAVWSTMS